MLNQTQQDEIAAIQLEQTPRWVAEHLIRLCERVERLEADLKAATTGSDERYALLRQIKDRIDTVEQFLMAEAEREAQNADEQSGTETTP